jgi:acetyltransferase-like isoleucine patch superfamily enzyme/enamine deaminase RidA (YjgF/YER057c/UK114 family)
VLYPGVQAGSHFFAHAHAVVRENCILGDHVTLENGVIIGADGFGFAKNEQGHWEKIPQSGPVRIGSRVDVQANATIDRATVGATEIGDGTKVDNLVQVGHGSRVGNDTLICAQTGLAGSSVIGNNVILAGQTGIAGHCTVGDGVILTAQSAVSHDVPPGKMISGSPGFDNRIWLRAVTIFQRLPELLKRLDRLEKTGRAKFPPLRSAPSPKTRSRQVTRPSARRTLVFSPFSAFFAAFLSLFAIAAFPPATPTTSTPPSRTAPAPHSAPRSRLPQRQLRRRPHRLRRGLPLPLSGPRQRPAQNHLHGADEKQIQIAGPTLVERQQGQLGDRPAARRQGPIHHLSDPERPRQIRRSKCKVVRRCPLRNGASFRPARLQIAPAASVVSSHTGGNLWQEKSFEHLTRRLRRQYSQAVRAAGLVFVSGTGPHDPATGKLVGETIQEQTRPRMCLPSSTVILLEETDFAGMNEEWIKWFPVCAAGRQVTFESPA